MIVTLHTQGLKTLEQVQAFVSSNQAISFTLTDRIKWDAINNARAV